MLPTYKAVLTKDRVQWQGETPPSEEPSNVIITFLGPSSPPTEPDGQQMAEALREISTRGGLSEFGDASQWQRDQRQDRPLPGRDE